MYVCEEKQGASGGRCFAVLRLANSPEQTHQRDQRQRCAPNHPGAASRAGGVSGLSSSVAYASQMIAKDAGRALEGTDMELRRGAQVGPSRTAGQAKPPTEHGDVRFDLQWTGLHQQAAAGRVSYLPHARWQMAAALATATSGRLVGGPERPQEPFITKARYSTPKPTAES